MDPRSGICPATMTFRSIHPPISLPPASSPLSSANYALASLPSPPPLRPALIDASTGDTIPYPVFLSQIRSLAAALRSQVGLSTGCVAFVLSPSRLDLLVLYFSLLSFGVTVSPANPVSTPSEIARLLDLSRPSVAFATSDMASKLPADLPTILLDSPEFQSFLSATPGGEIAEVQQSDAAAILYSSGTTGLVKGVVLTHRNLIAYMAPFVAAKAKATTGTAVLMATVPLFHAYGFLICAKAVAVRDTVVIQTKRFDAKRTLAAVERFRVTNLALAPPAVLAIVRVIENDEEMGGGGSYDLSSLRMVHCGGAPLALQLIERFMTKLPNVGLSQGYGLTESTSGVIRSITIDECRRLGACGRLMPGLEAKIVDPVTNKALPPGLQGELWLKGSTIMKGYIGDQDATSEILNSEGWLRTGDLCYIDEDGFFYLVDRLKNLIKYKGYQVPPAELENLLQTHPEIIQAAVVPYPDEEAGQIPVAFVVRQAHSTLKEDQVVEFVANKVAPYKRIRRVFFVESLPVNATGKILRKDLTRLASSKLKAKL